MPLCAPAPLCRFLPLPAPLLAAAVARWFVPKEDIGSTDGTSTPANAPVRDEEKIALLLDSVLDPDTDEETCASKQAASPLGPRPFSA